MSDGSPEDFGPLFRSAWASAHARLPESSLEQAVAGLRSPDVLERLTCVMLVRLTMEHAGARDPAVLPELADVIAQDTEEDCKWQAAIAAALFLDTEPEMVWEITAKLGRDPSEAVRTVVACVLLEHCLERYPERFRDRARALATESEAFQDTLSMVWAGRERKAEGHSSSNGGER